MLSCLGLVQDKDTDESHKEETDRSQTLTQGDPAKEADPGEDQAAPSKDKADSDRKDDDTRGQQDSIPQRRVPDALRSLNMWKFRQGKKLDVEEGQASQ